MEVHHIVPLVVSIHPPRVGRDSSSSTSTALLLRFQSTLPVWGGTVHLFPALPAEPVFQSTLPVWGGTTYDLAVLSWNNVSIHPPRVGRDQCSGANSESARMFQSTLPVWGGTIRSIKRSSSTFVSIHPPRVGRDRQFWTVQQPSRVSIHPPRVGRDLPPITISISIAVSIHPPRVGRDFTGRGGIF